MTASTVAGSISDGVPPPKKMEVSVATGQQPRLMREVGEQRVAPGVLIDARADMAVEVAIGAFADAERPVDVAMPRSGCGPVIPFESSRRMSLRNASARWLMRVLSSGSISPKVWS